MLKRAAVLFCLGSALVGCDDVEPVNEPTTNQTTTGDTVYSLANKCVSLQASTASGLRYLTTDSAGKTFRFDGQTQQNAARFVARPADLGVYILRDVSAGYVTVEENKLTRNDKLLSDTLLLDDDYVSPAEWELASSETGANLFRLKNVATGAYLGANGVAKSTDSSTDILITEATNCDEFPELTVDASGEIKKTHFDDGTLYGVVDAHSHLFTNFGFGASGAFHGAPFHRLGVEHALPDCTAFHGVDGKKDLVGYFYGGKTFDVLAGANALLAGEVPEFDHHTEGYPTFTDWPNARKSYTHQAQYYRWIERSYRAGLRLLVMHATSNQVLCDLVTGIGSQKKRISCNEMVSAERSFDETYALERYIDAQMGGPGKGWFKVVTSPKQAREVIADGKLAVILGIETSNLFDCYLTPPEGYKKCDDALMKERLDYYHEKGVRALFPVHKFDNGFSAGDGHRGFIELGSVLNSGYYTNFTLDCDPSITAVFDHGNVQYGGFNNPRDDYDGPAPLDVSGFAEDPKSVILPQIGKISQPSLEGEYCQNAGLTPLGENLILEMMKRGMILEIDHLPKRSYGRAIELLVENEYPAAGTHGSNSHGVLYSLGGISAMGLPRCGDDANPNAATESVRARFDEVANAGGYRAQGFGFDMNGFAGAAGPRFGKEGCSNPQKNPITYPFKSYAGDVELHQPRLGNRVVDFNTEGMVHIGLMPELIEDARHVGVTDEDLEPLFRSAEGYIRMWERAEQRAEELGKSK